MSVVNAPPEIRFAVMTHLVARGGNDYGWIKSEWSLEFIKRNDRWKLVNVTPLRINNIEMSQIRDVMRMSSGTY
jgi:hypothetical protein